MGSCLGRCISKQPPHPTSTTSDCIWREATDEQEAELMSNASDKHIRRNFIYRILKYKRKHKRSAQFIDKFWEHQDLNYAKLANTSSHDSASSIQLQNLDVNHLFTAVNYAKESALNNKCGSLNCATLGATTTTAATAVGSSRASSSLDLEWEHEYVHLQRQKQLQLQLQMQQQQQHQNLQHDKHLQPQNRQHDNQYSDSAADLSQFTDASWQMILPNQHHQLHHQHHHHNDSNNNDHDDDSSYQLHSYNSLEHDAAVVMLMPISQQRQQHQQQMMNAINAPARGQYTRGNINRNGSFTRTSSHNSWSHISTPESLEWDIDEEQQQQRQMHVEDDNLDHETLQLLHQIEQLKNQVLNETGDGLEDCAGIELNLNGGDPIPTEALDTS